MSNPFNVTVHFERSFEPTQIQAGQVTDTAFRSENLWYRDNGRVENFKGLSDTGQTAPVVTLTGTVTMGLGDIQVNGTGTHFADNLPTWTGELQRTSFVLIGGDIYSVREINSSTQIVIDPPAQQALSGVPIYLPQIPIAFDVDYASLSSGSIEVYQQRAMLVVGVGPVRAVNTDQGFDAKARLQIGIPASPSTWTPFDAGLSTAPPLTALIDGGAGAKNMHDGVYSMVLARKRSQTNHVGTAGDAVEVSLAAGHILTFTVPAVDAAQGQTGWVVYGSLQGQTTQTTTDLGRNGPWYKLADVTGPSMGTATFSVEYRNEEVVNGETAQYDNDIPPDASYLASLNDVIVLLGCHGQGDTRPGAALRASKQGNPEAFPARAITFVNPAERIVGVLEAIGKIYPMTENRLHIATLTGVDSSPLTSRPFWGSGFKHQQSAVLVGDKIYGFSGGRPTRSGAEESIDQEDHTFAARVQDIVNHWHASKVIVGHDPFNKAVVFIHSNDSVRGGKRISTALCYMLETERWSGLMILADPTGSTDFVVSGVVALSGELSLVANGKIWRWDRSDGHPIPWYITTPFMDAGQPADYKTVTKVEVIARTQNDDGAATVALYKNNDLTGLVAGNAILPVGGSKALTDSPEVHVNTIWRTKMRLAKTFAVRVEGVWPGDTDLVSLDEINITGWHTEAYF